MLVKYGVIEKMKYPWFYPRKTIHKPGWEEFVWDDVEYTHRWEKMSCSYEKCARISDFKK